ncbi:excinuclease ABC subunit UvrC [Acaryochloris sp. IP29b_bin.148]|uniref:excinuclease ABC subunit UvrC n=1 Tax=Acaryochloris sp. IP29b_bin.148 TaxID=2969218 RepID=UPI0026339BA9|nr:excinuclease ABC subunit UvrC [Acaryochloris sp. IP29b_bin.148]
MTDSASPSTLLKNRDRLEARLREIPPEPGVYFMRDANDDILYIGKSKKLRNRVRSYFRQIQDHPPRIELMVHQVADIEFIVTDTEAEALALEANLIKQHQPHFNVLLKDDKKYPYLCVTWSQTYPRIFITRKRRLGNAQDKYYGPYVDVWQLRQTLRLVKRLFPLRQRRKPLFKDRPCLNYEIGRCPGVCQELISPAAYRHTLQKVVMIFQGRTSELIQTLSQQMEAAAEALNFEQAARLRDQIKGLQGLGADQKVALPDDTISRDAIALAADDQCACVQLFQIRSGRLVGRLGFMADVQSGSLGMILQHVLEAHYGSADPVELPTEILVQTDLPETDLLTSYLSQRKGRKVSIVCPQRQLKAELVEMVGRNAQYELARMQKSRDRNIQALQDLATLLDLPDLPHRLECYDISHIQGSDAVASRVVFLDGLPAKQHYRRYKIRNPHVRAGHSDDFASLAEVLHRRFRQYQESPDIPRQGTADWPDLVVIDGGKGQLSAVMTSLTKLEVAEDLQVISLAKQREEIFQPGASHPVPTDAEQPGVQLLRRLRDEAHRFAISFHRQKRLDRMRRSRLDDIPGLGHHRQKELLAAFRSVDYIREASPEQLENVPTIGPHLAQKIYDYFHPA